MSTPLIKTAVKWWFRIFIVSCVSVMLGIMVFVRTGIKTGIMTSTVYSYAAIFCVAALLGIVWINSRISTAPEMIEEFLKRTELYKD
jgi:hypothetical protein